MICAIYAVCRIKKNSITFNSLITTYRSLKYSEIFFEEVI